MQDSVVMHEIDQTRQRVANLLVELGIPKSILTEHHLDLCMPPRNLVETSARDGTHVHMLESGAATAWASMTLAADTDGVDLYIVSAYRSIERQAEIFRRKLAGGRSLSEILSVSAPPGYSEHHSGRAIDIGTRGFADLEVDFQESPAFFWLSRNAAAFGFTLSFPPDNIHGYTFEPWHWLWQDPKD